MKKSKRLPDESIHPPFASSNCVAKLQVKVDESWFTHKKVVDTYIVHEPNLWSYIQGADFALGNSTFGALLDWYTQEGVCYLMLKGL